MVWAFISILCHKIIILMGICIWMHCNNNLFGSNFYIVWVCKKYFLLSFFVIIIYILPSYLISLFFYPFESICLFFFITSMLICYAFNNRYSIFIFFTISLFNDWVDFFFWRICEKVQKRFLDRHHRIEKLITSLKHVLYASQFSSKRIKICYTLVCCSLWSICNYFDKILLNALL